MNILLSLLILFLVLRMWFHVRDSKNPFFYIFQKYNILRVYCENLRPKYEIFTKLQHIVESAPRLINLI